MADAESYLCFFCSSDIRTLDEATTVPNMGVLVHRRCYQPDVEGSEHGTHAAAA